MLGSLMMVIAHPVTPLAWWALNQPAVTDAVGGVLGVDDSAFRRLQETTYTWDCSGSGGCTPVETTGLPDGYLALAIGSTVGGYVISMIIWLIVGFMYKSGVTQQRPPLPPPAGNPNAMTDGTHKFGLIGICEDCTYCLHGWCCEPMVLGDVFETVGASSYWCVLAWYFGSWLAVQAMQFGINYAVVSANADRQVANVSQLAWFIGTIPLAIILAGYRKTLREKLGDPNWSQKFGNDCVCYWLCSCCSAIQDARQLDAFENVKVECCCKLVVMGPPPSAGGAMGAPVAVGVAVGQPVETNNK